MIRLDLGMTMGMAAFCLVACAEGAAGAGGEGGNSGTTNGSGAARASTGTTSSNGPGASNTTSGTSSASGALPDYCSAAPCGGDVAGSWRYTEACGETPWLEEACGPGNASMRRSRYVERIEGTATFDGAGTAQIDRQVFAGWEIFTPRACLLPGAACDQVIQGDGVVCTDLPDACDCTSVVGGPMESASEPYHVDAFTLTIGAPGEEATLDYCVTGQGMRATHPETGETLTFARD